MNTPHPEITIHGNDPKVQPATAEARAREATLQALEYKAWENEHPRISALGLLSTWDTQGMMRGVRA